MTRSPPIDPDLRRAQLLQAANRVFSRTGYHAAGVADIITEAGVARGTFYNYFESKRTIFQAVLEVQIQLLIGAVRPFSVAAPIAPQIRENLYRLVGAFQAMGEGVRILFTDAAGIDDEGVQALASFYRAVTERLTRALTVGQALDIVRPGDPQLMAMCLIGMFREPVYQSVLQRTALPTETLVAEMFRFLTEGVMKEPDEIRSRSAT